MEATAKMSYKYGEYGPFGRLLFVFSFQFFNPFSRDLLLSLLFVNVHCFHFSATSLSGHPPVFD